MLDMDAAGLDQGLALTDIGSPGGDMLGGAKRAAQQAIGMQG